MKENDIIIIGAGIAGLVSAITLAENNVRTMLVSNQQSERAGSCMAEGGINAAISKEDSPQNHYEETCKNADGIADKEGIRELTKEAPKVVEWLKSIGTKFTLNNDDNLAVRSFGGQKIKRTVYAGDSTGKQIMTALIDETRKYEANGMVERYSHHSFQALNIDEKSGEIRGCIVKDIFTGKDICLNGRYVLVASGGFHGLFGNTTGAKADDGEVAARLFAQGVKMSNLEFIQYHPTTIANGNKRLLITEAARGEGGRLCVIDKKEKYYFMEKKYPEFKNLMPRDITSREIATQKTQVYLDMTDVDKKAYDNRLSGFKEDCRIYMGLNPEKDLIPVEPGIHYFMGGIWVDNNHRTSMDGLYAAGECACCYHGANRLGGNSLLGAAYGGKKAAENILKDIREESEILETSESLDVERKQETSDIEGRQETPKSEKKEENEFPSINMQSLETISKEKIEISKILNKSLGVIREKQSMTEAVRELEKYSSPFGLLAKACVLSALHREESRGAHYRNDFPDKSSKYQGASIVTNRKGEMDIEICGFHKTTKG